MTLLRCDACRWSGMLHCSDVENCGGMRLMTWEETEKSLEEIRKVFVHLHDIGEKNWSEGERATALSARARCRDLAEHRYSLLRKK